MHRSNNRCLRALFAALLLSASGCQLFSGLGIHPTNRHGVPLQSEPDVSQLEQESETNFE
jgi:hypothetical protein